jgi:glycogen(starch) synthase
MDYEGIPIHRFHFWRALAESNLSLTASIRKEIVKLKHDFQPDLIHINFSGYTAFFQLNTATTGPAPTLVSLHLSLSGKQAGPDTILARLLRTADWVTADSQSTLSDARAVVPEIRSRSSLIYNCQEVPDIDPQPLPAMNPRIMCIGRLAAEKGFDLAVSALGLLKKLFPKLSLTIVGDGPERAPLENQVVRLGLQSAVEFTGIVAGRDVPRQLNRAMVVVIPSRCQDSFPLVAVEAAQMGRPIVAANAGGLREAVVHGETGLLVEMENSQALADAVAFLLENPEVIEKMGRAARARALVAYDIERYIDAHESVYRKIANAATASGKGRMGE